MNVNGVSMTLQLNHLWESGELFIFLFRFIHISSMSGFFQ
jgi:hypothetical protein